MARLSLPHGQWSVRWPDEHEQLVSALAVAAAYAELVRELKVLVRGDVAAAGAAVLQDLHREGISDDELPEVSLLTAPSFEAGPPLAEFVPALVAACEYERRPWRPPFPEGDPLRSEVWDVAAELLAHSAETYVTVFSETLAGSGSIEQPGAVTLVAGSPIARREARHRAMTAVPRPPAPEHVPGGGIVVLDVRRPDDLALVASSGAEMSLANTDCVNRLAVAAIAGAQVRPPRRLATCQLTTASTRSTSN